MADWSSRNIMLTTKGAAAISKVQSGIGKLTITKVVASEQYVSESTLREVTSLSVENLPLTVIDRHEVSDGGSVIKVQLNNLKLASPFVFNEIGVFATHSDSPSEEFLYIIAQVNADTGDRIPLYSTTPITATYDIYLYNVGADNVAVTISSSGLVTYEALNEACRMVKRSTSYTEGDIRYSYSVPIPYYLRCKVKGTTSSSSIVVPSDIKEGDTITDGTVVWEAIRLASYHELQTATTTLTEEVTSTNTALAESTGYGIVNGCTPSISGLTVTVASGVVHLSNGTRKELSASTVTLNAADASNPRIDLVYIDSTGTVAKVTGTVAASPTVPSVPSGGISVAQVSVAAKATVGTLKEYLMMLQTFDLYLPKAGGTINGNLKVTGKIDGTASFAEKDSAGNVIPSTYATKAEVNTQISGLVDSAPDALNTLKELAVALGNDQNFSTTITKALAEKLPKTGGTMTGDLTVPALHGTADSAIHAKTADNATHASNADNATHASNADNATHASNADNSTVATTVLGDYTHNGGRFTPNQFGRNRVGFLMSNDLGGNYKNWLIMDNYDGNDGGGTTALGLDRGAIRAYIMRSNADRQSWVESAELITSAIIGAQSVTRAKTADNATHASNADNADTVDGYHASDLLSKIYPVGSIYMSMSATNPHDLFGVGTWERISLGRMLLGADDSTYIAGAAGGEPTHTLTAAEMPAHSHNISNSGDHAHFVYGSDSTNGEGYSGDGLDTEGNSHFRDKNNRYMTSSSGAHTHAIDNAGLGAAHNNMPPYLVCYIWQRTA